MDGFDWDEHNAGHIARHDVTPMEVEEMFRRPRIEQESEKDKGCFETYGTTESGRYLVVVFIYRHGRRRTITAYPMNRSTRKRYASKLKELEK